MKIVSLAWVDSETNDGWTPVDETTAKIGQTYTVGFLVRESADMFLIAHSFDPATNSVNGLISIPKLVVYDLKEIGKVKDGKRTASRSKKEKL
jgi:hypothetical protein